MAFKVWNIVLFSFNCFNCSAKNLLILWGILFSHKKTEIFVTKSVFFFERSLFLHETAFFEKNSTFAIYLK